MTALCGLFYGYLIMATDVDVQYFSHLNGLVLGNNWGDLIRLLDKTLVTGIDFTQITAASIDAQGDVHVTLYAAHNAMLFQVVELSGFVPASFNQKYRIKGVPSTTELILKPYTVITETTISTVGSGKLASLGYDIIFRDIGDIKRVYRAKNPTAQHPFIRVDETISDGVNSYNSAYAKYAMVGLLEHMDHIDDFENPDVLQLPFNPTDPAKNWRISGTGTSVLRGWAKWYWSRTVLPFAANSADSDGGSAGTRSFSICGDAAAFYFLINETSAVASRKIINGCGLFNGIRENTVIQDWFLMALKTTTSANTQYYKGNVKYSTPLMASESNTQCFSIIRNTPANRLGSSADAIPILPDATSGISGRYNAGSISALEIPFSDDSGYLRGTLKHILYSGKSSMPANATPYLEDNSIYIGDNACGGNSDNYGGFFFYLGEVE